MSETASSAILLLSDLFRKEFLPITANSIGSRMTGFSSTLTLRLTSKVVGDSSVKPASLAVLRREHANAAAVAQLVHFIQKIHDIEPDFECANLRNPDASL